jgi:hypothetical protein
MLAIIWILVLHSQQQLWALLLAAADPESSSGYEEYPAHVFVAATGHLLCIACTHMHSVFCSEADGLAGTATAAGSQP